jgi:hypothetical protein
LALATAPQTFEEPFGLDAAADKTKLLHVGCTRGT